MTQKMPKWNKDAQNDAKDGQNDAKDGQNDPIDVKITHPDAQLKQNDVLMDSTGIQKHHFHVGLLSCLLNQLKADIICQMGLIWIILIDQLIFKNEISRVSWTPCL